MENNLLIEQINKELATNLPHTISLQELKNALSGHINGLIQTDFEQLVNLLYRVDVHEEKIKTFLQNSGGENAADIIAALIIERQLQKVKSRQQFKSNPNNETDEEKW